MRESYYWPTIFANTHVYVKACDPFQYFKGKQRLPSLPLDLVIMHDPFQQWGLDFNGQFHQNSNNGLSWIMVATNYFINWVEVIPLMTSSSATIAKRFEKIIITCFGFPDKITTNNANIFISVDLMTCSQYGIALAHLSNYYPQRNCLANSSNKNLIRII